jgi:hypothetical protein
MPDAKNCRTNGWAASAKTHCSPSLVALSNDFRKREKGKGRREKGKETGEKNLRFASA